MEPLTPHDPFNRRRFLQLAGVGALSWLTPVGQLLARAAEKAGEKDKAQSVILLWLGGGPSQLETFDPHPDTEIAGDTQAIATAVRGVQLAQGFEQLAEQMGSVALVRSVMSKEGDHERGTYLMKTGFRPDPTVIQPSIGAICCHELPAGKTDIPRHISILPNQWPGRGGFLGDEYDAFKCHDPADKIPDVRSQVTPARDQQRVSDLDVVEKAFGRGHNNRVEATLHRATVNSARTMMTSEQLQAFEVEREPLALRKGYGDTPFGRGCLAARRLIEVGVRCVEVTLDGWDTHTNNFAMVKTLSETLDPAFSTLLADLKDRGMLANTLVVWMGEFGRTPIINPNGGRDHFPLAWSTVLAGASVKGGQAVGNTGKDGAGVVDRPVGVSDFLATVFTAVGVDPAKENFTEGRPIRLVKGGTAIAELVG
jgi:uncharacterized protein (DUF1501 family)